MKAVADMSGEELRAELAARGITRQKLVAAPEGFYQGDSGNAPEHYHRATSWGRDNVLFGAKDEGGDAMDQYYLRSAVQDARRPLHQEHHPEWGWEKLQ